MSQNKKSDLFYGLLVIGLATLITVAIVLAWQEPTSAPPGGNVPAPVNVGPNPQYKSAALGVGGLSVDYGANLASLGGDVKIGTTTYPATFQVSGTSTFNGNVTTNGNVHATAFVGDGSQLTGIGPAAIPSGVIVMWSGTLDSIPSGWALCDGTNGTPDLRDKFIYGVAAGENPGATGGSTSHTHALPFAWNRNYNNIFSVMGPYTSEKWANPYNWLEITGTWKSGEGGPVWDGMLEIGASNLPPYYKLAYIMKL